MRTVLLALLIATAAPTQAAECVFQSRDGWTFSIEDKSEAEYRVVSAAGTSTVCAWMTTDEGTGARLDCEDGTNQFVEPEGDALSFGGRTYIKSCDMRPETSN